MSGYPKVTRENKSSYLSSFVRWLQLKKYQYEVTFSLYMLTPTEKFVFNFILFMLVSLLVTAAYYYLPDHVFLIYNRVWYYLQGELAYSAVAGGGGNKSLYLTEGSRRTADALTALTSPGSLVGSVTAVAKEL
ncbi:hypothetical protein PV08_00734 [Exophiala spinifera]|uniref:Uncharacterized protein n=1 Tax=Exophiala spinifera TaxID=91928 RepID=A0A0D2C9A1_9EURO|nr:uncharacterized protein PV08_00734 [Exophiala spinifera]KIW20159.1 hypothetical protein PV08_00734 [Exophiala spinifera]